MLINKCRLSRGQEIPLSFSQKRLWFLQNLYHDEVMYNTARCFKINGPLDIEALHKTLHTLALRHEPLRSRLQKSDDGAIFQVIDKGLQSNIEYIDLRTISPSDIPVQSKQVIRNAVVKPFDRYNEQMLRVFLVRTHDAQSILLFVKHHLITDFSSWRLFLEEFEKIYTAITGDHQISLPPLKFTYSDFAKKQELSLTKDNWGKMHSYWKKFFEGHAMVEPSVNLSLEKTVNSETPSYDSVRQIIPSQTITDCRTIAQSQKCTLFMIVLTSIVLLVSYLYRTSKVLLCFANANRRIPGIENLIGCFFTNTIVAVNIRPKHKLFELIHDVRETVIASWQNQDIPFEMFAEDLNLECTKERKPPYRIYISYRKTANDTEFNLANTQLKPMEVSTGRNTHEDIVFNVVEKRSDGELILDVQWLWRTDLFDKKTIQKALVMLDAFLHKTSDEMNADVESLQEKVADNFKNP